MASEDTTEKLPRALVDWEERLAKAEQRIKDLEKRFEERGYNTRPMFEVHEQAIEGLAERLDRLEDSRETAERELSSALATPSLQKLVYVGWAYFEDALGTFPTYPFCPKCYDIDATRMHLTKQLGGGYWCANCRSSYHPSV